MSKFNTPTRTVAKKTTNLAGGPAFKMEKKLELFSALVTTFLQDKFYENAKTRMKRIQELAGECDPEFVAKCAVWARTEGNMRSAPVFLTAALTKTHNGDDLVRRAVRSVVNRADEITELLGAYRLLFPKAPFSRQMVKGIADAFNKFNEYQFAKYNRDGDWRLKDALFLAYPKGKNKTQSKLFDKIATDSLKTAKTWETALTAIGEEMKDSSEEEKIEAKGDTWKKLIEDGKLGHMALLRNLRNILDTVKDKKLIAKAAKALCDEKSVQNGKQFPFRYLAAYQEIEDHSNPHTSLLLDSLEDAIAVAAGNIPGFSSKDTVLIASDVSGSMSGTISDRSQISVRKVGLMLATMLRAHCKDVQMGVFADTYVPIPTSKRNGIIQNCLKLDEDRYGAGGGTNGGSILDYMIQNDVHADKVLIFTDCELWMDTYGYGRGGRNFSQMWELYKRDNPNATLYIINVAGYGTVPIKIHRPDVIYVAGWTEKVFKLLEMLDNGERFVNEICKVEL